MKKSYQKNLDKTDKVSKRHGGARSPFHKENHKTNARIQNVSAEQTLMGVEAMYMIRKRQAENNSTVLSSDEWLNKIFVLLV